MEDLIKYINNPALVILLTEIVAIMSFTLLVMWFSNARSKRKALKSLKSLANEIKQNNDEYKTQLSKLLNSKETADPAAIEAGMKKLLDSQENLVKDLMVAVRTRDHEVVSSLGESINDVIVEAVNIGRVSGKGNAKKLEQENEELTEKLDDASTQMNSLMKEYKSMFPEEAENGGEIEASESASQDEEGLMDISDDLEELDNAISQVAEEKTEQEVVASDSSEEEGDSINLDDVDVTSEEAANESNDEEQAA